MTKGLIEVKPDVMMGKPVVAGTRITVELVLETLAAGETMEQLLAAHPRLTREGILAALEFAGQALKADLVYPLEPTDACAAGKKSAERAGATAVARKLGPLAALSATWSVAYRVPKCLFQSIELVPNPDYKPQ